MPPILYHTNPCCHTPAIRRVVQALGAEVEFRQEAAETLPQIPGAVYGLSPILVDGAVVVEDWRLIVRHLDEQLGSGTLTAISPLKRSALFDLCEEIDRGILRPAAALLIPAIPSPSRDLLSPLLGSKKAVGFGDGDRTAILEMYRRIAQDNRLHEPEFAVAKLMFDGATDFLKQNPEFSTRL